MKRPILLALAVGVAAVALWPRRASASVSAPSSVPVDALARLGADARARRVASIAWDTWAAEGIPPIARVGLLAIGWHETRLNPTLRSAAGLRDDALGGSWGAWQVAARTAAALGRPSGAATLGDSDEAIREQARTAAAFARYSGLLARALRRSPDAGAVAGELATAWGAGHSRDLAWVLASPLNASLSGRIDSAALRAALAAGSLGQVGAMVARRILTAREIAGETPAA
jgi:hypothetical protein